MDINTALVLVLKSKVLKQGHGILKKVLLERPLYQESWRQGDWIWNLGIFQMEVMRLTGRHLLGRCKGRDGCMSDSQRTWHMIDTLWTLFYISVC
jgi:hypothetical protein